MGNSSSSRRKVSTQDRAILDLKVQRDKLQQYQRRITVITKRETEIARECLRNKDRQRALLALRRKKYQETLLSKTDAQLAQLESLTSDVEFALVQKDVFYGLQQGTAVLKEIHKEMGGIDAIEKLMGDGEEEKAYQQEVSELLRGSMSVEEEEEVEDELRELEARVNGQTVKASQERPVRQELNVPKVPDSEPGRHATTEIREELEEVIAP